MAAAGGDRVRPCLAARAGPHRLRRDADGLLLLDVDVPDWSWWLLPTPSEGADR
ncbi:hypothetical protein [Micromonospora sp. NPDC050200]|uniref:hypothetical protein n=1 Tax=Micromonospora sp. NPDC050200 TaxID=3155664 RepID=UPI0033EA9D9C